MKIKNILCFILAVVMVASLSACAGASVPASIDEEGTFVYAVTRSFEPTSEAETAAKQIRLKLKETFDCKITILKDKAYDDFDGNYEILVGDTDREESAIAKQRLTDNRINCSSDFIVAVIDDKICIQTVNNKMMPIAYEWFIANFCESVEDWAKLRKGYEFIYAPDTAALNNTVAGVDLSKFTVVLPRKTSMLHGLIVDDYIKYYDQHDYILKETEDMDPEEEYEILIGDCDREASKAVTVEGDNYVIKVVGKKLVVKGGTHLATWRAFKALLDEVKANEGKEVGINWADGYIINGKYDATEDGTYTLNWGDEFEGSTIDLTKWSDYRTAQSEVSASCLGGKFYHVNVRGESAYEGHEKKGLVYQADGELICGTKRLGNDFITTQISTYWTMTWKYGCMDIYSKLAPDPAYTTYWANGSTTGAEKFMKRFGGVEIDRVCMTEIDILENYSRPHEYGSTVHWWYGAYQADGSPNPGTNGHKGLGGNSIFKRGTENSAYLEYNTEKYGDLLPDDYHMYSFYWDDKCIKWAFDGKVFMDYDYTQHESVSVHCLMNYFISSCAMGSPTYGYTYSKEQHGDYYEHRIDYIRLYQTGAINSQMIIAWPETQENGTSTVVYPENTIGGSY